MAAKKKAGKAPVKTKKVAAKKPTPKKPNPKPTRAAAPTLKRRAAAKVAKEPAITNSVRLVAPPEWWIVTAFVDNLTVFGLGNDQRVYRWNTRSASWVVHQDGAQPAN